MTIKPDVEAIRRLMREKRMSMAELSRLTGISQLTLDVLIDRDFFALSYLYIKLIAAALQVEPEEIWKEE